MLYEVITILFSAACFANMLGLNVSSGLKSVVAIYILIPLILVPQLLFSGVIVRFEKLHGSIASDEYVPVIGELMVSRWAYEALAVNQFKNNKYQKYFFEIEKEASHASYVSSLLIPELNQINYNCKYFLEQNDTTNLRLETIRLHHELSRVAHFEAITGYVNLPELELGQFNDDIV